LGQKRSGRNSETVKVKFYNHQKLKIMPFGIIILIRILFAASMVFVIGYIFGNFSKSAALTTITKVASILAIVLFISANIFLFRFGGCHHNSGGDNNCGWHQRDTTMLLTIGGKIKLSCYPPYFLSQTWL
jgi:hypothetical protein